MQEFHENGLLHRDLKPGNIMLARKMPLSQPQPDPTDFDTHHYSVKLIDFGMARDSEHSSRPMTNLVGSLFYRAPELLLGAKHYGTAVDVWALGCVFYFMVTGTTLFKAEGELAQLIRIVEKVGLKRSQIKEQFMREQVEKLGLEDREDNWEESLKLMNEI